MYQKTRLARVFWFIGIPEVQTPDVTNGLSSTSRRRRRRTSSRSDGGPEGARGVAPSNLSGRANNGGEASASPLICDAPVEPALVQSTRAFGSHEAVLRIHRPPHPGAPYNQGTPPCAGFFYYRFTGGGTHDVSGSVEFDWRNL